MLVPGQAQTRNRSINVSSDGSGDSCATLKVKSDGEIAQAVDKFTLQKSEAAVLEVYATDRGILSVRGWDRPEYSVEACRIAVADTQSGAEQLLRSVAVMRTGARFTYSGSQASGDGQWQVYFFVHAPKDGSLDLQTTNGPISVRDISGNLKVRATNGPISVKNAAGLVEVHTSNGPISFEGGGGEVHLNANNGPIALKLSGDFWNGSKLDAHTTNGPVSLTMPSTFHSGVRVETDAHSPVSCRADACRSAFTDSTSNQRILQLNGTSESIRVSTSNGPVSVSAPGKSSLIM
jgi:hypothetical protein